MNRLRILGGLVIFIFSVCVLMWALYPTARISRIQTLQPILLQSPESTAVADFKSITSSTSVPASKPLVLDGQQLILVYPSQIRYGDTDVVQLVFKPIYQDQPIEFDNADGSGFDPWGTQLDDWHEKYLAIAEARLDLVGMDVRPSDLVSEPFHSGGSATFFWSIKPVRVGSYQGTAWLYMRIIDPSTGLETRKVVTAQIMEIKVVNFLGLSTSWVLGLGWISLAVGVMLGISTMESMRLFPFIIELTF